MWHVGSAIGARQVAGRVDAAVVHVFSFLTGRRAARVALARMSRRYRHPPPQIKCDGPL
jgi:hypothetical protein